MRTKSTLLIILIVFLSHNHSTLGRSIIPYWTFTRIFTLCNSMCNSILTPIKTRLARIGSIFSTILHRRKSVKNKPIENASTTSNAPEQIECEYFQKLLEEKRKQLLYIIDKDTNSLTTATLFGYGSLAAFHGLGKTTLVPQLMAHYSHFKIASILNVAYPFALLPTATLLIGGLTVWKMRCIMHNHRKDLQTKLDEITDSFNNELIKIGSNYCLTYGHPISDSNIKTRLKTDTEEYEKNNFNSTNQQPAENYALMTSAKKEEKKQSKR